MRIIETEAGRLTGKVDRAERRVVWSLECPMCAEAIALDDATFEGRRGASCPCGYRAPALASVGDHRWFDFRGGFETVPPAKAQAA